MIFNSLKNTLQELVSLLETISIEDYTSSCKALSNATIGEHTRHIVEMFECLLFQYDSGSINYDLRNRDFEIQTQPSSALNAIKNILENVEKQNKELVLTTFLDGKQISIPTNFFRELYYNLDHCIHHQALIKVAINLSNCIEVDENFGVAKSTIEYRKQCVQ
jgi:hypothetical protein